MQAVIFDVDYTLFRAEAELHEGVADLLRILKQLNTKMAALSNHDHRVLVRLQEAGIRHYFTDVVCADHLENPKAAPGVHRLLRRLNAQPHETTMVSRSHADILLAKDVGLAKTIGVSHGHASEHPLRQAGADHVVLDIPTVLDVLH